MAAGRDAEHGVHVLEVRVGGGGDVIVGGAGAVVGAGDSRDWDGAGEGNEEPDEEKGKGICRPVSVWGCGAQRATGLT